MDARIDTTRFRVDGMDCAACASKVDTATRRVAGVEDVSVSVMNGTMTVRHTAGIDLQEIAAKVGNLGYPTRPVRHAEVEPSSPETADPIHMHGDHDHAESGPWWKTRKAILTLTCGAALLAAYFIGRLQPEVGHWSFLVALLVGLVPIGRRAVAGAMAGSPFSIETLMSIAAIGAVFIGATEEAAMVVLLFLVGELLEGVATSRARTSIRGLTDLVPKTALLVEGDAIREVPVASLALK
ncbi:MAG TPA: cation transporter, partial [Devosia sp.]|nr:cation transporter [Devosia sp.]